MTFFSRAVRLAFVVVAAVVAVIFWLKRRAVATADGPVGVESASSG